jgi:hypothetical protein
MNFLGVIVIGAVLGALNGVGISFAPEEPYKWQIPIVAIEGYAGWAAYRLFLSLDQPMVVRDGKWGALWSGLQSRDLSCKGRPKIGRCPTCDSERDSHRRIDRPLYNHLGGEKDPSSRRSQPSTLFSLDPMRPFAF